MIVTIIMNIERVSQMRRLRLKEVTRAKVVE